MPIRFLTFLCSCLAAYLTLAPTPSSFGRPSSKKAEEKAFLESNRAKPEIHSTKSGLQYQLLRKGEGSEFPNWRSTVSIHLKGSLIDGTVFENTLQRETPVSTKLDKLIPGCREAIKLMNVGDKYRFYVPSKLGYGRTQQGDIPPYSVLVFEIELYEIKRR
ncbi:FKBP-type peptidyl-prolyl cis-trans isomerase [Pelagicoccus sp. NFK12]|uniref:Peptidyl-prolyl cis-trans isomerase n=1 Tax=Pelagicoccus enzymogenes TaxID=2773457 RepID=A0A927IEC8_9BACT|nr:FKBP-type peptidyl-prolyl cis-trans isomerase [Pelagicoccus enzymogenes]MBD5778902.1 FKBP-type peptidyl-prolyl cis-trans isomerase [Pelagicoccus enzymogenes]